MNEQQKQQTGEEQADEFTVKPRHPEPPQPTPRPGKRHFSPQELARIRALWQAEPEGEEHTSEHLRLNLKGGSVATITRRQITSDAGDTDAIRASIETAAQLWGGA